MLHPNQFKVNQAWIAVRVNDSFLYVAGEPYDLYILVDAASAYVFGHLASKTVEDGPELPDIEGLFQQAGSLKNQYPIELIVPDNFIPKKQFKAICDIKGIGFREVPEGDLSLIIDDIKQSFEEFFS